MSKYWLQTQAPAGNWVDNLGANDLETCASHGRYLADNFGDAWRVVKREDKPVAVGTTNKRKKNPRPRIGSAKPGRVSSATGKRPTKRLVSRRKSNTRKGYFPNPGRTVGTPAIIALARKHAGNGAAMESSARFALAEAIEAENRGDINAAKMWAIKSLSYSVGIFHADYKKAAKAAKYDVAPKAKRARKNPVRPLAKRAGIRFYRQAGAKWLMFDPASYPAKTKNEALKIARALGKMFQTQIKIVIDK